MWLNGDWTLGAGGAAAAAAALPDARVPDAALGARGPARRVDGHDGQERGHRLGAQPAALQRARGRRRRRPPGPSNSLSSISLSPSSSWNARLPLNFTRLPIDQPISSLFLFSHFGFLIHQLRFSCLQPC